MKRALLSLALALTVLIPLAASPAYADHRDDWSAMLLWIDDTAGCAHSTSVGSPCLFVVYHLPFAPAGGSSVTPDVVHLTWQESAGGHKSSQMEITFNNGAPDADNEYFLGDLRDNDTYSFSAQYCVKHTFSSDDCSNIGSLSVYTFDGPCPPVSFQDTCYTQNTSSGLVAVSTVRQSAAAPAPAATSTPTPAPLPKAPAAPKNFTGTRSASDNGILLTWDVVPGTDYFYLTAYSHDGNVAQTLGNGAPKLNNGTTFFKIDGGDNVANLVDGVDFNLQACNAGGCSSAQTTVP